MFYILIAVALLGALSFAVARSDGGNVSHMKSDQAKLYASEIIEYGDTVKKAVMQLRLRGTALADLSFAHDEASADYGTYDADPDNEVFNLDGGKVIYNVPPSAALDSAGALYEFYATNGVEDVGSDCAAASCSDLIMAVAGLDRDVCVEINDLLSITNPSDEPPVDSGIDDSTRYAGSFGYAAVLADEGTSSALAGQTGGCYEDTGFGLYVYYQVLIAR